MKDNRKEEEANATVNYSCINAWCFLLGGTARNIAMIISVFALFDFCGYISLLLVSTFFFLISRHTKGSFLATVGFQ